MPCQSQQARRGEESGKAALKRTYSLPGRGDGRCRGPRGKQEKLEATGLGQQSRSAELGGAARYRWDCRGRR